MSGPEQRPPQAPEIERRLQLRRFQWIGLPLLMLIPILALTGAFDERRTSAAGANALLELRIDFPSRLRKPQVSRLEIEVRNLSVEHLDAGVVSFDPAYLAAFSRVQLIPSPAKPYTVELRDLVPGEARQVRLEGEGKRYGWHSGEVIASAADSQVRVQVSTFLIP